MKPTAITSTPKEVALKPFPIASYFEDLNGLMKQIEQRAYELFELRGRECGHSLEDWLKAEQEFLRPVAVEITDQENAVRLRAEVPGFKAEELDIYLEPQSVTIKGFHEQQVKTWKEKTEHSQLDTRQIFRTFSLPAPVLPDGATAKLKNNVLEITAQKAERPQRVTAKAA